MILEPKQKRIAYLGIGAFLAIVAVFVISSMIVQIPSGRSGILLVWGESTEAWNPGLHIKWPIGQEVQLVDTTIQKAESAESTASKDLQEVTTTVAVNYRLNPNLVMDTWNDFRRDYEVRVIKPAIEESLKAVTAKYTAEELVSKREDVKQTLDALLTNRVENIDGKQYFIVVQVSLTDFQFSPSFSKAIEAKVEQEQIALAERNKLLTIQYQQQQKVITAEAEKNATIARAEGEARATILNAVAQANATRLNAEAMAYQIDLINSKISNSPYYINYEWIKAWDGKLPMTVFGDDNIELLLQGGITTP